MGRLMDADKLKEYLQNRLKEAEEKFAYEKSKEIARHTTKLLCDDVDTAETVEAIPVPWIERYIADCGIDGTVTMLSAKAVNTMLEVWKGEQK